MRGITTPVTKIRRQVFTEIARLAYEDGDYSRIEELPYTIIPGEVANYRDSVFKERAIVGERLRLAVGLPRCIPICIPAATAFSPPASRSGRTASPWWITAILPIPPMPVFSR